MATIQFGTDGWRAIRNQDFIPQNIEKVIQAFCDWQNKTPNLATRRIVLGFDSRYQGQETANLVAQVLTGNNFTVEIANQFCPTPCISWLVKSTKALCGIMVTASHNPWQWNGIKFKESYGGSASPEYTSQIEKQLKENEHHQSKIKKIGLEEAEKKGLLKFFNPKKEYVSQLKTLVDIPLILKSKIKVLYDSMHGAGSSYLAEILSEQATEIHNEPAPEIGGTNPEPIDKNLKELLEKVGSKKWDVGLATDGDADRIGAVDEDGNFVSSHLIFALLLKHYVEDKKLKGTIVKSISTTQMIPLLCKKYDLPCLETPIGFRFICQKLVETNALMGGEESGGISFAPHVHERDGLLNGLFLLEMMAYRKKTLKQLIQELNQEMGTFYFNRVDLHLPVEKISKLKEKLRLEGEKAINMISNPLSELNQVDGFKFTFKDKSWLLLRSSGTEPLLRIYAEAPTLSQVNELISLGEQLTRNL